MSLIQLGEVVGKRQELKPYDEKVARQMYSAWDYVSTLARSKDVYIAGGSVRDWAWGKRPKDIDIFVWEFPMVAAQWMTESVDAMDASASTSKYGCDGRILRVSKPTYWDKFALTPLQIIVMNEAYDGGTEAIGEHVQLFSLALQQCWMDLKGVLPTADMVQTTPAFELNKRMKQNTVEFCGNALQAKRILEKHKSIAEKYPNYSYLDIPDKYRAVFGLPTYGLPQVINEPGYATIGVTT